VNLEVKDQAFSPKHVLQTISNALNKYDAFCIKIKYYTKYGYAGEFELELSRTKYKKTKK
ncbi:hypothetical protein H4219_006185, partial [Mycoemilia scoparia]